MFGNCSRFRISGMYSEEYFLELFKDEETENLRRRYSTEDLSDNAKAAMHSVLKSRGFDDTSLAVLATEARKAAYRQTKGTKECDYCGSSARFSPVLDDGQRFCNVTCLQNARLMEISEDIPKEEIFQHACRIKEGACPGCSCSKSKVEARKSYRIWSVVHISVFSTQTRICCHSCARKENFRSLMFCAAFGWWGFPWGVGITPVQIISNIVEMFKSRSGAKPSDDLLQAARINLAAKRLEEANA